jgi:hypothetical protein
MAQGSDGWDSIRLKALCLASADWEAWTVPV